MESLLEQGPAGLLLLALARNIMKREVGITTIVGTVNIGEDSW